MPEHAPEHVSDHRAISRRNFVALAVSSLATLPAVEGGFLVPRSPEKAFADEAVGDSEPVEIVVVSPREVGFYVTDQTDDANAPIAGAHVVVTSRYNGKVLDDYTGPNGIALFDIAELAEENDDGTYAFNGTIDITASGYREFHMALARIEGHTPFYVPTRKVEPNRPYPSRVSFAEWDILYVKNCFASTDGNEGAVPIEVEVRDLGEPATLSLRSRDGSAVYASTALTPSGGVAKGTFSDQYLLAGSAQALPVDGEFCMQIETSDTIYEFPIALQVKQGAASKLEKQENATTTPVNATTAPDAFNVTIPNWVPYFESQSLNMWTPKTSFSFVIDPFGYVYFAYKTPRVGYDSDAGKTSDERWGVHTYDSAMKQYDKFAGDSFDKIFDTVEALSAGSLLSHVGFTPSLSATLSARFTAAGKWDWGTHEWQGDTSLLGLFEVLFTATEQFGLGPVPVFISLRIAANAALQAIGGGFVAKDALDFSTYEWDWVNTGFTLTINLSGTLSAGIGVAGVASVGARGTLAVMMYLGLTPRPQAGLELPHAIIGFSGSAAVEIQFFLFKWSGVFWSFDKPNYKDNWNKGLQDAGYEAGELPEAFDAYRLADGSFAFASPTGALTGAEGSLWSKLYAEATPVTAADLAETCELAVVHLLGADEAPVYDFSQGVAVDAGEGSIGGTVYPWDEKFSYDLEGDVPWQQEALRDVTLLDAVPGVERIDLENGGIWPSGDILLESNVFSDPRIKQATCANPGTGSGLDIPYVFRIASVSVNGEMRTRLVYQDLYQGALSPAQSLEFETGIPGISRADLYDYDFDVAVSADRTRFFVILLSGTRDKGDDTTPYDAFENLLFTYVELDMSAGYVREYRKHTWKAVNDDTFHNGAANAFFCPTVTFVKNDKNGKPVVSVAWLHRFADDESVDIGGPDAKMAVGSLTVYDWGILSEPVEIALGTLPDNTAYDMVVACGDGPDEYEFYTLYAIRGEKGTTSAITSVLELPYIEPYGNRGKIKGIDTSLFARLVPWPGEGHEGFLASYDDKLCNITMGEWNVDVFEYTQIADFDFSVNTFGLDESGTIIYFPDNRHGVAGYRYDDDGQASPVKASDNRIMASKLFKGTFSEPYVLSNIGYPVEQITHVPFSANAMTFIITSLDSLPSSAASLWFTAIPAVAAPALLAAITTTPLVASGDYARFVLTIRNDGNVHLTGGTVEMLDEQGVPVSSCYLEFSEETLQPSVWNAPPEILDGDEIAASPSFPDDASFLNAWVEKAYADEPSGRLLNTLPDYELAPGKTGVYAVSLQVPESWEGTRSVTIRVKDPTYVKAEGFEVDDDPILLGSEQPAGSVSELEVTREISLDDDPDVDAPVTIKKKGSQDDSGNPDDGGSGDSDSGASGSGSSGSGKTAPRTGDTVPLGPLTGALGALAAAGAGLAFYSARRQSIEEQAVAKAGNDRQ